METISQGWRDDSVVKNTCCSCRGPRFGSWHPHGGSGSGWPVTLFWPLWARWALFLRNLKIFNILWHLIINTCLYYTFCLEASRDVKVQDCPPLIGGDATGALIVGSTFWVLFDERLEKIEGHSSSLSCVCVYVCETGFKPRVLKMLLTPALKIVVCL